MPAEQGGIVLEQGIQGNFDFPGLREFIFDKMPIVYTLELPSSREDCNKDIFEYWKKFAKTGDAEAQNNFGLMYSG